MGVFVLLDKDNYRQGFLLDDQLMGGVSEDGDHGYIAYVIEHQSGEYLGYQPFADVSEALKAINAVQRPWQFEPFGSGCGGGQCGSGDCDPGACALGRCC